MNGMNEMNIDPDVVREAVSQSTDDILQTIGIESQTIQEQIADLSAQVSDLQEEVTASSVVFSLQDIATMLVGLQKIFEPQLRAKAFAIFDETSASIKSSGPKELDQLHDALVLGEVWRQLGILPRTQKQFFEEWKKQKAEQSKVSAK
jgi:hypothetical protein